MDSRCTAAIRFNRPNCIFFWGGGGGGQNKNFFALPPGYKKVQSVYKTNFLYIYTHFPFPLTLAPHLFLQLRRALSLTPPPSPTYPVYATDV